MVRYPPLAHVSHRFWTAFVPTLETGPVEFVRSCIINCGAESGLNRPRAKLCFTRTEAKGIKGNPRLFCGAEYKDPYRQGQRRTTVLT